VLAACPACGWRIRGRPNRSGRLANAPSERPSFCDGCGTALPWASREERIFELENLLDEEDIGEADRVIISGHLQRLRDATLSEKEERVAWEGVKSRAGKAITSGPVQRVLEGLVSAAIRNQLGI